LFWPPTLLGEVYNLGYHSSITLGVSSTCCPCLLLNLGLISGVADGAIQISFDEVIFGTNEPDANSQIGECLGNNQEHSNNSLLICGALHVGDALMCGSACTVSLQTGITNSDKFCWFALCQFLSSVYVDLLWLNKSDPYFTQT